MNCLKCKGVMSRDVNKWNSARRGRYRIYSCAPCSREIKTFQPEGKREVVLNPMIGLQLCDCGDVALKVKAVQIKAATQKQLLYLCPRCFELEQRPKPKPKEREKPPVVWRGVYGS